MQYLHDEYFSKKEKEYKRPLKHVEKRPRAEVKIQENEKAFQKLCAVKKADCVFPLILQAGDSVVLDFGEHCVGYLHYSLSYLLTQITDSPILLRFTFGEFLLELVKSPKDYEGVLGNGWLQNETRRIVFTPYQGKIENRYPFRYLKIERLDNAEFPMLLSNLFADCVSAVEKSDVKDFSISDERLKKIYDISINTLKECEQDVFEDGLKRDCRLWLGDLRLQALTDYVTFQNVELIKRCIYLFAAYRWDNRYVAQCIFNSFPYVYEWIFFDYSLFFISCLYDYAQYQEDISLLEETYPRALEQVELIFELFERRDRAFYEEVFIDWCKGLDKSVAILGVFIYALKQFVFLSQKLHKDTKTAEEKIACLTHELLAKFDKKRGLFVTDSGQISWQSQIWAVLANVFSTEENVRLLQRMKEGNLQFYIHTPYMMHYYIEALYQSGQKEQAMEVIKEYWGKMVDYGFDCCLEVFNDSDHFESPYNAPEINSACHAWSCTPAYWIYRYYHE